MRINGQVIRVAPNDNMVIVYLSSWPDADGGTIDGYGAYEDIFEALKIKFR